MSFARAKYEFPIDVVDQHHKADAPTGVYLLNGEWRLAVHGSVAEFELLVEGALLIATLSFALPTRPRNVAAVQPATFLSLQQAS